jgi:hypothetical protein
MTVQEARKLLGYRHCDYVRRLLLSGVLLGEKDEAGRWNIDSDSVRDYKRRVEYKRSSTSKAQAVRDQRKAEAAARYAT